MDAFQLKDIVTDVHGPEQTAWVHVAETTGALSPALVRLLDAGREVLPALLLLESLLHACHPNVKALLRVRGTVPALAQTLAGANTNASGAGTAVAVSVCSTIRVLEKDSPF